MGRGHHFSVLLSKGTVYTDQRANWILFYGDGGGKIVPTINDGVIGKILLGVLKD